LGDILSQGEVEAIMGAPKFKKVTAGITNNHMKAVGKVVDVHQVIGILDQDGIPHNAYGCLFRTLKNGVRQVDKNLNFKALPTPFRVSKFHLCPLLCFLSNHRFVTRLPLCTPDERRSPWCYDMRRWAFLE
jgi:hypothetical protein